MSDRKTLDELYAEDQQLESEIANIRRKQQELKKLIWDREAEVAARRQAAFREGER